jgi:cytochrome c biogenesis protein CcmG, thiol:disulfide interchange protein DsbE
LSTISNGISYPCLIRPLVNEEFKQVKLSDYRGKWVLVNVWASWCTPCRDEAPALRRFHERHRGDHFAVVGIAAQDGTDPALEFIEEFGLDYPHLRDGSGDFSRQQLGTRGVPETFLADPDGNLVLHFPGVVDEEYLESEVAPLIEGGSCGVPAL